MIHRGVVIAAAAAFLFAHPCLAKDAFTVYGDVGRLAIPAAGAAIALVNDDTDGLKQFVMSGALTLGATYALKYAVNERRPDGGSHSFPSGHTSSAFWGAAYIHQRYGWQWGIPAELAAAAVALSRIDARKHHWQDVIASAGIAHLSAYVLVDHKDAGVTLLPLMGERNAPIGLLASIRF